MKRSKPGDVFLFRTPQGVRFVQWAYYVPGWGKYVRVLPEHYTTLKLIGFAPDLYYFAFMLSTDFGPGNWKPLSQPELWFSYREQCMRQDLFTP